MLPLKALLAVRVKVTLPLFPASQGAGLEAGGGMVKSGTSVVKLQVGDAGALPPAFLAMTYQE
jgi:hypothetical protein